MGNKVLDKAATTLVKRNMETKNMTKDQQIKTEIETAIKELDPKLDTSSAEFMAAATLLASASVGPNAKRISDIMRYPIHKDWTGWDTSVRRQNQSAAGLFVL